MKIYHKITIGVLSALLTLIGFGSCKSTKMAQKQREKQLLATIDSLERTIQQQQQFINRADSMFRSMNRVITVYGGPNMMDRRVEKPDDRQK